MLLYFSAAFLISSAAGAGVVDLYVMQSAQLLLAAGVWVSRRSPRLLAMILGSAAAVFSIWVDRPHPGDHLLWALAGGQPEALPFRGEIIAGPQLRATRIQYDVLVDEIDGVSILPPARVQVSVAREIEKPLVWPGDEVEVFGVISRFVDAEFPRVRARRLIMEGRGLSGRSQARDGPLLMRTGGPSLRRWFAVTKNAFEKRVLSGLDELDSAITLALITGNRTLLPPSYVEPFRQTDTAHLLAISGLHFGALSHWLFGFGLILIGFGQPWLRSLLDRWIVSLLTLVVLGGYLVWIGAPLSAQRAWLMSGYGLLAGALCRHGSGSHSVALAAVVIVVVQPSALFEIGFQLSFASVLGIVLYVERWGLRRDSSGGSKFGGVLWQVMCLSAIAGLSTWPVWLYHVGEVHPIGLVANWIAVPWVTMIVFPLLALGALLCPVVPQWSMNVLEFGCSNLNLIQSIMEIFGGTPTWVCGVQDLPTLGTLVLALVALVCSGDAFVRCVSGTCFVGLLLVSTFVDRPNDGCVRAWFLPVGQGDSIYVEIPGGTRILIDAGGTDGRYDPGRRIVVPFLKRKGVRTLDLVVASHADLDHAGGLKAVLQELEVKRLAFHPKERRGALVELEAQALKRGIEVVPIEGETVWSRGHQLDIILRSLRSSRALSSNDRSLTMEVRMGRSRVLLSGDIEAAAERELASRFQFDSATFTALKIPHHGSKTSSSDLLLDRVDPDVAVISVGSTNRFGHPHDEVLERLDERGIPVLRTDRDGLIEISICPGGIATVRACRRSEHREGEVMQVR